MLILFLLTRLNLINSLIERAEMLLYTLGSCAAPLIILFVWLSFTPPGQTSVYSRDQLIWYFILAIFVKLFASAWGSPFLAARIRRGAISPFLIQPIPYIFHWISNNIAEKIVRLIMITPFLFILVSLFHITPLQVSLSSVTTSIVSLLMAAALFFLFDIAIGLLSFWLDETTSIGDAYGLLSSLFSGVLIPLIALPQSVRNISYFLPFRYTLSLPIEIALGQISGWQIYLDLGVQLVWLVIIGYLCRYLWLHGLKVYSASGA